jgi:FAD dependent oxidoreductase
VRARVLVDCTGDANVVTLAGLEVERNAELQPGTLVFSLDGYDVEKLDLPAIQAAFEKEVAAGRLARTDTGWTHGDIGKLLRGHAGNCVHVVGVDGRTSEGRSQAEIAGRQVMLRLYRFLRRQPELGKLRITFCAPEVGIRETVTIKGRTKITGADYETGRLWPDAVCYSFYPIDVHTPQATVFRPLREGVVPTIPFGALLPERGTNIIVAGRCIAGDKEANSAYRVEASCMAMGQVAGAAAAVAVQRGVEVAAVPLNELRALLRQHGAIVPAET